MNKNYKPQYQINKNNRQDYLNRKEKGMELKTTQVFENSIKTKDLGLVAFMLMKQHELTVIPNNQGVYSINKKDDSDRLYQEYREGKSLINAKVYAKTIINLLNNQNA